MTEKEIVLETISFGRSYSRTLGVRGCSRWRILDEFVPRTIKLVAKGGIRSEGRLRNEGRYLVAYRISGIALPVADALTDVLRQGAR